MECALFYTSLATPIGVLQITANDSAITSISKAKYQKIHTKCPTSKLLDEAIKQLGAYFAKRLMKFSLPLQPQGSAFEKKVWQALTQIPYGHTSDYKTIATQIHSPKAYRAVGNANHKNPILILIPCHRITQSGFNIQNLARENPSKMGGYALGVEAKRKLLSLEYGKY